MTSAMRHDLEVPHPALSSGADELRRMFCRSMLTAMACAFLAACSTTAAEKIPDPEEPKPSAPTHFPKELQAYHLSDDIIREFDMAGDGKPDLWKVYRPAEGAEKDDKTVLGILVRKEIDLNHDGKPDIWRYYDTSGAVKMEAYDFDFDGKIDQVSLLEGGSVTKKGQDLNGDGESDQWITYEKGEIVKKERDSTGDGKVDYWEYWEDGAVSRIGIDEDGDGQVDRWSKSAKVADDSQEGD